MYVYRNRRVIYVDPVCWSATLRLTVQIIPLVRDAPTPEDVEELCAKLRIAHATLAEWQRTCLDTVAVWRQLIAQVLGSLCMCCFFFVFSILYRVVFKCALRK